MDSLAAVLESIHQAIWLAHKRLGPANPLRAFAWVYCDHDMLNIRPLTMSCEWNEEKKEQTLRNMSNDTTTRRHFIKTYRRTGITRFDRRGGGGGTPDSLILCKLFLSTLMIVGRVVCFAGNLTAVLFTAQFMRSFCRSNDSMDPLVVAFFCASNCVVKLMICDNRLGSEYRACGIDSSDVAVFGATGNDCGRITLLVPFVLVPFIWLKLAGLLMPFSKVLFKFCPFKIWFDRKFFELSAASFNGDACCCCACGW